MDGGPNRIPERSKWLIWTVCSYYTYRECVWSEIESAHVKMFHEYAPRPREPMGRYMILTTEGLGNSQVCFKCSVYYRTRPQGEFSHEL